MMAANDPLSLHWLPVSGDFDAELAAMKERTESGEALLALLQGLANRRLDFMQTRRLDRLLTERWASLPAGTPRLRLSLIGSQTLDHLVQGIRLGALRRGLLCEIQVAPYGQWRQQILDPDSELYRFRPEAVFMALDRSALLPDLPVTASAEAVDEAVSAAIAELVGYWQKLREGSRAALLQQSFWSEEASLFGHFERLVPASPGGLAARLDVALAAAAAAERVMLFDLRAAASLVGIRHIADAALWHHAKQAVSPAAVPWLGDHIGRILAALRGLSKKVLVLDLDNTLWGGVIGDDGLEGIVLGQGSGTGEAYAAFQRYAKSLASRGVVLAVSSKNDRAVAEAAFAQHPEMVLRQKDFAAFEADWNDKPSALCRIAEQLELGLDSMVFFDDNPVERSLMRRTLPQVAVPEVPEAPELYARCLADSGYFEAISFTSDDAQRNEQYGANRERRSLQSAAPDMASFLRDLEMTLTATPFDGPDVPRITQLINKTNQFNLTTRRYTEAEVRALMEDPQALTLAARLTDRFGDNGLISVVIGRLEPAGNRSAVRLDSWLMSCRVLGRRVEEAMLGVLAARARQAGAEALIGCYRPTPKNGMVKDFYPRLGFDPMPQETEVGASHWVFPLAEAQLPPTDHLRVVTSP